MGDMSKCRRNPSCKGSHADVALPRQRRGGQRHLGAGFDDVHRVADRGRSGRLGRRVKRVAVGMVGHEQRPVTTTVALISLQQPA
ncbi:MAG: hypothetical protein QOK12_2401 [Mycobacterium sp.]|nr:hypothetical protein [Mycobacterium sp.]